MRIRSGNNNSGMALVGAVLMMLVVTILGQSMLLLTRHQSESELRGRLLDAALYIADAGIEKAILGINNGNVTSSFVELVGQNTDRIAGEASVVINSIGNRRMEIISTGHVPSVASSRAVRTVRAEVEIFSGFPPFATMTGGQSEFSSFVNVYGVVFSNDPIIIASNVNFYPDSNGELGIYCAAEAADSITIGAAFGFDRSQGGEIRSRGGVAHGGQLPLDAEGDWWHQYDDSISPIEDVLFVDADVMIKDSATLKNHDFGANFTLSDGRAKFGNRIFDLEGKTYHYPGGMETTSPNTKFIGGGNFVLGGIGEGFGSADEHALYIDTNNEAYLDINFIVAGGEWKDGVDILITQNMTFKSIIQCPGDARFLQWVTIDGMLAVGGDLDAQSNVHITYDDDIFDSGLILKEGDAAGVTFVSWRELR